MRVIAAIVTWNGHRFIASCLESLAAQTPCPDVIVIDNASTDDTVAIARTLSPRLADRGGHVHVCVQASNLGYTRAANVGITGVLDGPARYDVIILLNQDVTLAPDYVARIVEALEPRPDVGAVGGKLYYPNGITLQHAGGYLTRPRFIGLHHGQHERDDRGHYDAERDVEFVTGAAIALRLACLEAVGLFDETFSPGYYEDVELCTRLRQAGWRVLYAPRARGWHVESASFQDRLERLALSHRNRLVFALPELADPGYAAQFRTAEREAFASESTEMLRALARAYLQATAELHRLARTRLRADHHRRPVMAAMAELLMSLRADCLAELQRRRRADLYER